MPKEIETSIQNLIAPLLAELQLVLYSIEYDKQEKMLRIYLHRLDGSMDLTTCVEASNRISAQLDLHDPIADEYILEVASPGAERPLTSVEDYQKAVGQYVEVELIDGQKIIGELSSFISDEIEITYFLKGVKKQAKIYLDKIKKAQTTVKI